jgi:phosphosulfolactate phosphohydrolase-like enzyme
MNITKSYLTIALSLVASFSNTQEQVETVQAHQSDEVVLTDRELAISPDDIIILLDKPAFNVAVL